MEASRTTTNWAAASSASASHFERWVSAMAMCGTPGKETESELRFRLILKKIRNSGSACQGQCHHMAAEPTTSLLTERPLRADARRNREKIVNAAREIVAEYGEAAQIDDVARKAGVGVGTVYRHFPNKDALMGELVRMCVVECTAVAQECATIADPWEGFAGMIRMSCERMAADAAMRRTWQAADDEAVAYAAPAKGELH